MKKAQFPAWICVVAGEACCTSAAAPYAAGAALAILLDARRLLSG